MVNSESEPKCRICGCTDEAPCGIVTDVVVTDESPYGTPEASQVVVTCSWVDESMTLCSNIRCLVAAGEATFEEVGGPSFRRIILP